MRGHNLINSPHKASDDHSQLTSERREEAEDVVSMEVQVPSAIAAEPRGEAGTPAGHPGPGDGVADGPVSQPSSVAPV